jgi:hypothetical protein
VYESEGGFGLAGVGLEALSVIFRKFVSVPVERAKSKPTVSLMTPAPLFLPNLSSHSG